MLNKGILQGRLTADPELRSTQTGKPVCGFTVAWSEKFGETEQKLFLPCVAWGKTAEFMPRYFSKGQEIAVEGKLITRNWQDKNGNNRTSIEMVVDHVHFCGPKQENSQGGGNYGSYGSYDPMAALGNTGSFKPYAGPEDDSDVPF